MRFSHIAWGLLIVAMALLWIWTGSWVALLVAAVLVVVPVVGIVCVGFSAGKLGAKLQMPTTTQKNVPVRCTLTITNGSAMPFIRVKATIWVANLLTGQRKRLLLTASVPPRGSTDIEFEVESPVCGMLASRATTLSAFEPFGLFGKKVQVDAQRRMSVMPALHESGMNTKRIYTASPLADTTLYSQHVRGQDASEVFGIREYEQGDDLRRVHWKLSSKLGSIMVREASLPLDNSLLVLWDKTIPNFMLPGAVPAVAPDVVSGAAAAGGEGAGRITGRMSAQQRSAGNRVAAMADAAAEVVLSICEQLAHDGIEHTVAYNDTATGRCFTSRVADEGDIYEMIGHAMSAPVSPAPRGGIESYIHEFARFDCSRLIYIGPYIPAELDVIRQSCSIVAIACDGKAGVTAEGDYVELHFAPQYIDDMLAELGVA